MTALIITAEVTLGALVHVFWEKCMLPCWHFQEQSQASFSCSWKSPGNHKFFDLVLFSYSLLWLFWINFRIYYLISETLKDTIFHFLIFLPCSKQQRWQNQTKCSVLIVGPFKRILISLWLERKLGIGNTGNVTLKLHSACSDALIAWANFQHKIPEVWRMIFHRSLNHSFNIAEMNLLPR